MAKNPSSSLRKPLNKTIFLYVNGGIPTASEQLAFVIFPSYPADTEMETEEHPKTMCMDILL
jgi:hypothetical protein